MIHRVYFNRSSDFPWVWSIDEGTQESEVLVMAVIILPSCVTTTHCLNEKPNPDSPVAWLEVCGNLEIVNDIAYFDV